MRVTILGHASLFFETAQERVLLDPVLRSTPLLGSLVYSHPRELDLDQMPRPTLIVVTHSHFDHFDRETLRTLPKDVPVIVPTDARLARELTGIGFADVRQCQAWTSVTHGELQLVPTPSDAPVKEFGLLVETAGARFWHMSDAEPPLGTAERIRSAQGSIDVVSAKFQPPDAQLNFQHNMGASFDHGAVASWLEAARACDGKLTFPYASGLCFSGESEWLNRYAYPFSAEQVSRLLDRTAAGGRTCLVRPGDVISICGGDVTVHTQASPFVRCVGPESHTRWEPFDESRLRGLASEQEREAFGRELTEVLTGGEFCRWIERSVVAEGGLLRPFLDWRARCSATVHMGAGARVSFDINFTGARPEVREGTAPDANYFTHVGAHAVRRLLAGAASPLEVMLEGSVSIFERIITFRGERFEAPPPAQLYKAFPDPLLTFAARRRASALDRLEC